MEPTDTPISRVTSMRPDGTTYHHPPTDWDRVGKQGHSMPHDDELPPAKPGEAAAASMLGTESSENFSGPVECVHGYGEGCPDCDVPAYQPTVLQNVKLLREIRTIGGDEE